MAEHELPLLDPVGLLRRHLDEIQKRKIATRIQEARLERGYSQDEAARLLGVTVRQYQNYESQSRPAMPPLDRLRDLADLFGKPDGMWFMVPEDEESTEPDLLAAIQGLQLGLESIASSLEALTAVVNRNTALLNEQAASLDRLTAARPPGTLGRRPG